MMSNDQIAPLTTSSTAGAQLRAAREALGLSQDAVAQQLKLAPRQVRAIEEDDYARLPGRTFVRGFVRNYARLVRLDPSAVMAGLPRVESTSPLDRPSLTAASRPMAELPIAATVRRKAPTRWLIPLVLIAIVAAAGLYEFTRAPAQPRRATVDTAASATSVPAAAGRQTTTALPNPLENAKSDAATSTTTPTNAETSAAAPPPTAVAPVADASLATATAATSAPPAAPPSTPAPTEATLVLTFKEKSWVEVKDGNGAPIFLQTGAAGTTQTINATPPLDVTIGNAGGVGVTFRGQPIDFASFTRANIARFSLK